MKHITEEQFMSYIYGEMDAQEKNLVVEHLASCPKCRETFSDLKATLLSVDTLSDPVPERLSERMSNPFEIRTRELSSIMTPEELAELLRVPLSTIYELLSDLPYLNLAGQIRFRRDSIERWLERREQNSEQDEKTVYEDLSIKLWRDAS